MNIFESPLFTILDGSVYATEHLFTFICGCYLAFVAIRLVAELLGTYVPKLLQFIKSKIKRGE